MALARAANADDADLDRARALFDEAGTLEREGQWTAAQERLRAAIRIHETPHLRYALGWALENDDQLLEARAEYETARRLAVSSHADEVTKLAETRLAELDRKTPMVEVRVAHGEDGARVFVDGKPAPLHGDVALAPVNPGLRLVRVERPGAPPVQRSVVVTRGTVRTVEVRGDTIRPGADRKTTTSALPWLLLGGGAAMALGGAGLLVSSTSDARERDDDMRRWCDATACTGGATATRPETPDAAGYRRDAVDAADRGNTKQIVGGMIGGVGVIGMAVGTYLLVRDGGGHERSAVKRAPSVRAFAAPTPGGAAASALFTF